MAGEVLRLALGRLDELTKRGGGHLAVLPQPVAQISVASYAVGGQDLLYIAWPQGDYEAINSVWARLAPLTGSKSPFGTNEEVSKAVASDNWLVVMARLPIAQTVDQIRASIRGLLTSLGLPTTPLSTPKPKTKFPWGWVAGTLALGVGIMISLNLTSKNHGEAP